jgi:hypothetical protein
MIKGILEIKGVYELRKTEQSSINGGMTASNCPTYPAEKCLDCGGNPRPNGCCMGSPLTHFCLIQP